MRGIPGQEDPAHPVLRRLPLVAVEAGQPAGVVHAEVGAQGAAGGLADLVERKRHVVGDGVAAVPGEDPVVAVAERGDEGERVAHPVDREHVGGRRSDQHVGQHDRLDRGAAGERLADRLAYGAAVAVGADHVVGPVAAGGGRDGDAGGVLGEAGHLGVLDDLDTRLERPVEEQAFHVELRSDQQVREPAGQPAHVHRNAAEQLQTVERRAGGDQLVGQPSGVQFFQRAGVHGERPGQIRDRAVSALEHRDRHPGLGQIPGEQQPGRSGSDDNHLGHDNPPRSTRVGQQLLTPLNHRRRQMSTVVGQQTLTYTESARASSALRSTSEGASAAACRKSAAARTGSPDRATRSASTAIAAG